MKLPKVLSFILILSLFSCQDDPVIPNNPPSNSNSFTLKKDGVNYNPVQVIVGLFDEDIIGIETRAIPNDVVNNTYGLYIKRSIVPGIYGLVDGESEYFGLLHSASEDFYFGWEDGTLNVLSNDTVAKIMHCQFEVTLYNDNCEGNCPEITDGEFTIHYF